MFWENKIAIEKINVESKLSTKLSCLQACDNNIEKAEKLYKFLTDDLKELPDKDIVVSKFNKFKNNLNETIGIVKDNKDDLLNLFEFVKSFIGNKQTVTTNLPELPKP